MNYLITIIIPTYNCEKTIGDALDSILGQSIKEVEVLIVDGLSTDRTLEIVAQYQTKHANIVVHSEKDEGIYDAMNKGIGLAKGDWLYFMGSDDTLFENTTLEKVASTISLNNADLIYGNVKIVGDTGWAKDGDIYDGKFATLKLLNKNISHQAIFYNTKFIKEYIGIFNKAYTICSDWDFNLRCWAKTEFYYVDIVIANFYSGGLSTNGSDPRFEKEYISNIQKYFNIDLFHDLLNNPSFRKHQKVRQLQKKYYPFKTKLHDFLQRISLKIKA
ncbi:MAG: glycosyl transferase [Pseudooceanicola sp.]|nr:glycosyl transferase [Pseudooceanicola sp.]